MKCYLYICDSSYFTPLNEKKMYFVVSRQNKKIFALYYGSKNLAPSFRRGVSFLVLPEHKQILKRFTREEKLIPIRAKDFLCIMKHWKQANNSLSFVLYYLKKDFMERIATTPETQTYLKIPLSHPQKKLRDFFHILHRFFQSPHHIQEVAPFLEKQRAEFSKTFAFPYSAEQATLVAENFFEAVYASLLLPKQCIRRILLPSPQFVPIRKKIRRILLLSNRVGSPLKFYLSEHFDSILKIFPGSYLLASTLTRPKLSAILRTNTHWDLVIYEGHSFIQANKICYPLEKGLVEKEEVFALPFMPRILHLSCLETTDSNSTLTSMPCVQGLFPIGKLPDVDFSSSVLQMLQELKEGLAFSVVAQAFTEKFPMVFLG